MSKTKSRPKKRIVSKLVKKNSRKSRIKQTARTESTILRRVQKRTATKNRTQHPKKPKRTAKPSYLRESRRTNVAIAEQGQYRLERVFFNATKGQRKIASKSNISKIVKSASKKARRRLKSRGDTDTYLYTFKVRYKDSNGKWRTTHISRVDDNSDDAAEWFSSHPLFKEGKSGKPGDKLTKIKGASVRIMGFTHGRYFRSKASSKKK